MRRIVYISGLHFGNLAPAVPAPLRDCVRRLEPNLVVIGGDLTAAARTREFREARAFLDTLPGPQIVVPGPHDVANGGLLGRFSSPLGKFRKHVSGDPEPEYADETVAVIGVSPPGAADGADEWLLRVRSRIHSLDSRVVKIAVAPAPLSECGADMVLTGSDTLVVDELRVTASEVIVDHWSWNAHSRRFERSGTETRQIGQGRETNSLPRT
jgi:3',5'-cyclic AMP phosphodiesterase CpdA